MHLLPETLRLFYQKVKLGSTTPKQPPEDKMFNTISVYQILFIQEHISSKLHDDVSENSDCDYVSIRAIDC